MHCKKYRTAQNQPVTFSYMETLINAQKIESYRCNKNAYPCNDSSTSVKDKLKDGHYYYV